MAHLIGLLLGAVLTFAAYVVYMREYNEKFEKDDISGLFVLIAIGVAFSWVAVLFDIVLILVLTYKDKFVVFMNKLINKGNQND